jgi:hypothetical protein
MTRSPFGFPILKVSVQLRHHYDRLTQPLRIMRSTTYLHDAAFPLRGHVLLNLAKLLLRVVFVNEGALAFAQWRRTKPAESPRWVRC